jgi:hypothetical protein
VREEEVERKSQLPVFLISKIFRGIVFGLILSYFLWLGIIALIKLFF